MYITYRAVGFLITHQIDNEGSRGNEEKFHTSIVQRDVIHEEVHVADTKHEQVQFLSFA